MNSNLHSSGVDTSFCTLLYANLLKSKYLLLLLLLFTSNLEQSLAMAFPLRMSEHTVPYSYFTAVQTRSTECMLSSLLN